MRTPALACLLLALAPALHAGDPPRLTPPEEIEARVNSARPLRGAVIPANLPDRLGATHYDGRYALTRKPYLVEGAEQIHRLGMRVAKFWLHEGGLPGYGYNSDWGIPLDRDLAGILDHKYYREALALPFTTVLLEVFPLKGDKSTFFVGESDFAEEEREFHSVAAYLLRTYAGRDITFILQNWEGDWMLRREDKKNWDQLPKEEVKRRCDAFVRFLSARQRGVERARREAGPSRARVYHAAEVNRVWDGAKGLASVTTDVLPRVAVDLVSWSSYDGLKDPVAMWQGVELIRHHMRPSPVFGTNAVFIGEIGRPEGDLREAEVVDFWDRSMGVVLAMNLPLVVHWELYCNEPRSDAERADRRQRTTAEMRGFWLVRPDGSLGYAGRYLTALLRHAGGPLPPEVRASFGKK